MVQCSHFWTGAKLRGVRSAMSVERLHHVAHEIVGPVLDERLAEVHVAGDDMLPHRPGAQWLAVTSGGTIPDRGLFGVFLHGTLQQSNAIKVILSLAVNLVAACSYLLFAFDRINWLVVALIAVGSLIGGFVGAHIGRRLSPLLLRSVIVVLGLIALANMVWRLVEG